MEDENLSDEISQDEHSTLLTVSSSSTENESKSQTDSKFYVPFWGSVFCAMASTGFVCMLAMRVSLSVALVAMVNQTAVTDYVVTITNITATDQCPRDPELQHSDGEFTWDRRQQAALLAAFYCGILISQVCTMQQQNRELETKPLVSLLILEATELCQVFSSMYSASTNMNVSLMRYSRLLGSVSTKYRMLLAGV